MRTSLLILLLLCPQDPPETLVRRLGSDSLAERDAAERALRALGAAALPALDAAGKDADGEVAVRSGRISRAIRLLADAPPALLKRFPQAAERVSASGDAIWVSLALEVVDGETPSDDADLLLRYLVPRALRAKAGPEDLQKLLGSLTQQGLSDALPDAVPLLVHPNEDVRDAAIDAIRELSTPACVKPLLDLLRKAEPQHRDVVARLLAQVHHPDSVAACLGLLRDPSPDVRQAALSGLRACPGRPLREAVESSLSDRDPDVRAVAVETLASLHHPSSVPRFRELLTDPDGDVREAALDGLARLRIPGAEPSILPLLADPEEDVRRSAVGALIALDSPAVGRELIRRLQGGDSDDVDQCLRWLQRGPLPEVLPALLERLKLVDADDHDRALEILKRDGGPGLLPALRAVVADEKDPRRLMALELLAGAGGPSPDPGVLLALRDPAGPVRLRALRGLNSASRPIPGDDLRTLLRDPDPAVRRTAVGSVRNLPPAERLARLLDALKDADSSVVEQAVEILAEGECGDVRVPLWGVVDGPHEDDTRRRALRTALQMSGPGDAQALLGRIADPDFGPAVFEMLPELGAPADRVEEAFALLEKAKEDQRCNLLHSLSHYDLPGLGERLRPYLKSTTATERAAAVEAVAGLRAWSLVPEVVALVEDPVPEVRRSAFNVLGTLDAAAAYPAARKILESGDVALRVDALSLLSEDDSPQTRALLRKHLDHATPAVSAGALEALGILGDESVAPRLLDRLRSGGVGTRRSAITALAGLPRAGGIDLLPWLDDPVDEIRGQAALAVGRRGAREAAPRLLAALEDPETEVAREALEALAAIGAPEAAAAATERIHARDPEMRLAAARALRRIDPALGRAAWLELLDDSDGDTRNSALREAAASGDEVLRERVAGMLRDPSLPTRRNVAYQVGQFRIRSATATLIRMLESADRSDRYGAVHALGALGDPAAIPALRRVLAESTLHWTRRSIAYALALCGDPAGVPLLMRGRASFLTLNAVRRPEPWRRLRELPVKEPPRGELAADLKFLADAAGLELEISAEAAQAGIRRARRFDDEPTWWTDAIVKACSWDVVPVIEEKTLRIVSRAEARAFFGAWWEAESKRLGER